MDIENEVKRAWIRGFKRGFADETSGGATTSPLSGEWAGESIPELLGDLLAIVTGEEFEDILNAYEEGYAEGAESVTAG